MPCPGVALRPLCLGQHRPGWCAFVHPCHLFLLWLLGVLTLPVAHHSSPMVTSSGSEPTLFSPLALWARRPRCSESASQDTVLKSPPHGGAETVHSPVRSRQCGQTQTYSKTLALIFSWKGKEPRTAKMGFKRNKVGGVTLPDFGICLVAPGRGGGCQGEPWTAPLLRPCTGYGFFPQGLAVALRLPVPYGHRAGHTPDSSALLGWLRSW